MKNTKFYIASLLIGVTIAYCFLVPKPKYQGVMILKELHVPTATINWRSEDFSQNIARAKDDRFNFLSEVFARVYGTSDGRSLLLLLLDAGNFHHPRLCYGGSGFKSQDLSETEIKTTRRSFKAKTFLARKGNEAFVVIYWMCINKERVDWTEQKFTQFWHSLFNKKQAGLMIRIDIPVGKMTADEAVVYGQNFISDLSAEMPADQAEWMFGK